MIICRKTNSGALCLGALLYMLFVFASCGEDRTYQYDEKTVRCHLVQDVMKEWYLWGDSLRDLDWREYFANPVDFVGKLAQKNRISDKWSYCLIDTLNRDPRPCGYFNHCDSYGMDLVLMNDPTGETSRQYARVVAVFEGSPAYRNGIRRNDFIGQVDNNKMAKTVIDKLVNGYSHKLIVSRIAVDEENGANVWVSSDTINLPKSEKVLLPSVLVSRMIDAETAYIMLADLNEKEKILPSVTSLLDNQPLKLIIDLRFCNQGSIDCAVALANMIGNVHGTMLQTIWNSKKSVNDCSYDVDSDTDVDLFFITSKYTQGAAEWLIHGLRSLNQPRMFVIGKSTAGQTVMLKPIPTEYQFTIYPAVAFVANFKGEHDYNLGIVPDYEFDEYTFPLLYPYGDSHEAIVNYIMTNY